MPLRRALVLMVMIGLAGFFLLQVDRRHPESEADKRILLYPTGHPAPATAKQLSIDISTDAPTVLVQRDGVWSLNSPVVDEVDQYEVERLVDELSKIRRSAPIAPDIQPALAQFGLDPPRAKIELRFADQTLESWGLWLGNDTPVGELLYAQIVGDSSIVLIDKTVRGRIAKPMIDLRKKRLLDLATTEIQEVRWTINGHAERLTRSDGRWHIGGSDGDWASRKESQELVDEVATISATAFVDHPSAQLSRRFASPTALIDVTRTNGKSVQFRLVRDNDQVWAKIDSRPIAVVTDGIIKKLIKTGVDLLDRTVMPIDRWDITDVEVSTEQRRFHASRDKAFHWVMTLDGKAVVMTEDDNRRIDNFFSEWQKLSGEPINLTDDTWKTAGSINAKGDDDKSFSIRFGDTSTGSLWFQIEQRKRALSIPQAAAEPWRTALKNLVFRLPIASNPTKPVDDDNVGDEDLDESEP